MAISKTLCLNNGMIVENAYIRVDAFYGCKENMTFSVNIYSSEEAFKGSENNPRAPYLEQDLLNFSLDVSEDAPNPYTQAYKFLLTQDKYIDAVKV